MSDGISSNDIFMVTMIQKLVHYDWNKISPNLFTVFFDDASSLLSNDPEILKEFNEREKKFVDRFGLSIAQAEERLYRRLAGHRVRMLVKRGESDIDSVGVRKYPGEKSRRVSYYEIMDELRNLRVWTIRQIRTVAEGIDGSLFSM